MLLEEEPERTVEFCFIHAICSLLMRVFRPIRFIPTSMKIIPTLTRISMTTFRRPFETTQHISVLFDADHVHDHTKHRSISGNIVFVGSTPVIWQSKHHGYIATSTYCVEFIAMRSAVEEAMISIRYMLRCLGVPVSTHPTDLLVIILV